ncbi:MAG: redoxin domain-containing protein [Rhodanobacter lindaniclasticus]
MPPARHSKEAAARLFAPEIAPVLDLVDIHGQAIATSQPGRLTLLSFFRDAACPFCNFRIYELTQRHQELSERGLDVVAVFSASQAEVLRFAGHRPRPFPLAADPTSRAHEVYGIERSLWRKLKAIVTRVPTLIRGLRLVGLAGLNTGNLMPADFLIDGRGRIVEAYYGRDAGDRIPLQRVESLLRQDRNRRAA